jgi:hypothetical protein
LVLKKKQLKQQQHRHQKQLNLKLQQSKKQLKPMALKLDYSNLSNKMMVVNQLKTYLPNTVLHT